LGIVRKTTDISRSGRLNVFIPALSKDPTRQDDATFNCYWSSPFAGSTDPGNLGKDIKQYDSGQKSYGMWMIPPDPGNMVLVAFVDGSTKMPYIIGTTFPDRLNHMVPGMPAGTSYSSESLLLPVIEKNRRDERQTHNDAVRPVHVDIAEAIVNQGLINDPIRGAGSSGARRESPSEVFGILTPGPRDPNNENHRLGGHQFVMDDNLFSRQIRLRTAQGHQLLMDDTNNIFYIINKSGTAWVELTGNGDVNVYSGGSISMRSKGNLNLRADYDVNIEAGKDVNIKACGDRRGGQYVGVPLAGALGIPALGEGGDVRIEAANGLSTLSAASQQMTSMNGDVDISSGGDTRITASGVKGVDIMASMGGIALQAPRTVTALAGGGFSVTTSIASIQAGMILLNSGGAPALPALPAMAARPLGTSSFKDQDSAPPGFNREAANRGESAVENGGKRKKSGPKITSIVAKMPTPEPYVGHNQYDPKNAPSKNKTKKANLGLPTGAVDFSGKPADFQSVDGTMKVGLGYKDSSGNEITNVSSALTSAGQAGKAITNAASVASEQLSSAAGDAAKKLAEASPFYTTITNIKNNIKNAIEHKILEISNLGNMVNGLKAVIPPIRFPTSNVLGDQIIGIGNQIS